MRISFQILFLIILKPITLLKDEPRNLFSALISNLLNNKSSKVIISYHRINFQLVVDIENSTSTESGVQISNVWCKKTIFLSRQLSSTSQNPIKPQQRPKEMKTLVRKKKSNLNQYSFHRERKNGKNCQPNSNSSSTIFHVLVKLGHDDLF